MQGWEKSIFDCDILYFLFIECTKAFTFFNECRIWPCLYFFFGAIRYSILFIQVTSSHFSKIKIIVGMSLPCFCGKKFLVTKKKIFNSKVASHNTMSVVCKLPYECEDIKKILGAHREMLSVISITIWFIL